MLVVVLVEMIPAGLAIVANVFVVFAHGEAIEIALRQVGSVFGRVGRVVAGVFVGVEEIEGGLVLEGSVEGGVSLFVSCEEISSHRLQSRTVIANERRKRKEC